MNYYKITLIKIKNCKTIFIKKFTTKFIILLEVSKLLNKIIPLFH